MLTKTNTDFSCRLLSWFKQHGRTNLPWQQNTTTYRVWVSEIMLQQTQVKTVIPYYVKFMAAFPELTDLANADDEQVMALWSGLGYYSRARNLHKTALILKSAKTKSSAVALPETMEELQSLPGIGRSTAAAIMALALGKKAAILDGNVKRVLTRCFAIAGWPGKSTVNNQLWQLSEQLTPEASHIKSYTQAIMDLGATICTSRAPACSDCPITDICVARQEDNQTTYPGKKSKPQMPVRHRYFFLLTNSKGELLMEKRPPTGLWGSLWTPPVCDINQDAEQYLRTSYAIELTKSTELPEFRHTFSHYHLQLHPIKAQLNSFQSICENNLRWDSIDNWLQQGIPAAVRKMLLQISAIE